MGITRGGRFPCIIVIFTKCGMKSVGLQSFPAHFFLDAKGGRVRLFKACAPCKIKKHEGLANCRG
jgi:hypothetical protein